MSSGPSHAVVVIVRHRDGWACVRCGNTSHLTTQHRIARGMGGTDRAIINGPANLITLCWHLNTGCHPWVEAHPKEAQASGWALPRTWVDVDPARIPVLYPDGRMYDLDNDGRRTPRGHAGGSGRGRSEPVNDPGLEPPWTLVPLWNEGETYGLPAG